MPEEEKLLPSKLGIPFEQHVIPEVGDLPVDRITLQQWLALLEELADDVPSIADRVLTNAKQVLKWPKKTTT